MDNLRKPTAISFLQSLYQNCENGSINIRHLPSKESLFLHLNEFDSIPTILKSRQDQNIYFGMATRVNGDGSKSGILQIPVLWTDLDLYKLPNDEKEESRKRYKDFLLKATWVIDSGGGRYLLWILKEPASKEDTPRVENLLKRLASYFHGDMAATDASRILRIPGSLNHKYQHTPQVKIIESYPERQYSLDDFEILPQLEGAINGGEKPPKLEGWRGEILEGVPEGQRNNSLAQLAGSYVAKRLSRNEILAILEKANSQFKPPLPTREVEACLDSILKTHQKNYPEPSLNSGGHHFSLIRAGEIVNTSAPQTEWIWEDILPSGGSSLVIAKPKVGKTTLALQLAVAISRGDIFLGKKTRQAKVVYLALEEHRDEVQKKLCKLGVTDEPLFIHFGPAPAQAMAEVEPLIRETEAKFLVIDILQKFCRVRDLNDYSQVTRALEPLMSTARKMDCHIQMTHHAGKIDRPDGDDILGSTGLLGGVDTSIHLRKRNKESRTFFTIQRYGVDVPETVIALSDGHLTMEGSREEVEIEEAIPKILDTLDGGSKTEREVWGSIEKDHSLVSKALRRLVEQQKVKRTGEGKKGKPYVYERNSLLLSSYIYQEGKRETFLKDNSKESQRNISLEGFDKNEEPQERIKREISTPKEDLYEVTDDGQLTY